MASDLRPSQASLRVAFLAFLLNVLLLPLAGRWPHGEWKAGLLAEAIVLMTVLLLTELFSRIKYRRQQNQPGAVRAAHPFSANQWNTFLTVLATIIMVPVLYWAIWYPQLKLVTLQATEGYQVRYVARWLMIANSSL